MQLEYEQLFSLCELFQIGIPKTTPVRIKGGFLHPLWRVQTTHGLFAIKQLTLNQADDEVRIIRGETIAAAFAAAGIPAAVALSCRSGYIAKFGQQAFLINRWIKGYVLSTGAVPLIEAYAIGQLLAKMHQLDIAVAEPNPPASYHFCHEEWIELVEKAQHIDRVYAQRVQRSLPDIWRWCIFYLQAIKVLQADYVLSHRDLYQPNVIWQSRMTPILIDWENAGLIDRRIELLGAALNWSGLVRDCFRTEVFKAVINAYVKNSQLPLVMAEEIFFAGLGSWLNWLQYNLLRSLQQTLWQQIAMQEVVNTLRILYRINQEKDTILSLFS